MPKLSNVLKASGSVTATAGTQPHAASTPQQDDQAVNAAIAQLADLHARRVKQHGPRTFRHPDGSLRDHPPPRNPHTVANRKQWKVLADYCRQEAGADRDVVKTGFSVRHGVDVTHQQHVAALQAIGLTPECDSAGVWEGYQEGLQCPLDHPSHLFRQTQAPYAQLAAQVFQSAPYQWRARGQLRTRDS